MASVSNNIVKAGRNNKTVIIRYTSKNGDSSERETEPYEIKDGKYYGYCLNKGAIRGFLLNNISSAEVTNNSYNPKWPVKL
ncbi:MAG: WYL domain-containing protein [Paraclostridium sp.]